MMYFCESCAAAMDTEGRCPRCGSKKVRPIETNDPIFLTEMELSWSAAMEDVLTGEEIPYRTNRLHTPRGGETGIVEFYVRWADYDRAKHFVELVQTELIDGEAGGAPDEELNMDCDDYDPDEEPVDPTPEQEHRRPFGF